MSFNWQPPYLAIPAIGIFAAIVIFMTMLHRPSCKATSFAAPLVYHAKLGGPLAQLFEVSIRNPSCIEEFANMRGLDLNEATVFVEVEFENLCEDDLHLLSLIEEAEFALRSKSRNWISGFVPIESLTVLAETKGVKAVSASAAVSANL